MLKIFLSLFSPQKSRNPTCIDYYGQPRRIISPPFIPYFVSFFRREKEALLRLSKLQFRFEQELMNTL